MSKVSEARWYILRFQRLALPYVWSHQSLPYDFCNRFFGDCSRNCRFYIRNIAFGMRFLIRLLVISLITRTRFGRDARGW